jgi:hypothetical protein
MTNKTFLAKLKAINDASDASYNFINTCYSQGLCSYTEAKKAVKKVHTQTMKEVEELSLENALDEQAVENAYQMVNYL